MIISNESSSYFIGVPLYPLSLSVVLDASSKTDKSRQSYFPAMNSSRRKSCTLSGEKIGSREISLFVDF